MSRAWRGPASSLLLLVPVLSGLWFAWPDPPAVLDAVIAQWMAASGADGAAVIVRRDGEVAYARSWGDASLDRKLFVGSASKWVAAAVALSQVDAGVLDLDAPLAHHLPELPAGITLRQALSHTAGTDSRHTCIRDREVPLRDCARSIGLEPLLHPPGSAFRYGASSYQLVGAAVEAATGRPWREVVRESLAEPLGWKATRWGRDPEAPNPGIAGNLATTPREFARFVQMVLDEGRSDGARVLSAGSVREMLAGQTGRVPVAGGVVPARLADVVHDRYGLGVWREEVDADGEVSVASCDGKFGFVAWIDRTRRIAGVFATEIHGRRLRGNRPAPQRVVELVTAEVEAR